MTCGSQVIYVMSEVKSEIKFLQGPQSRWDELTFTIKTLIEFIRGFRALHFVGPCVTFFGNTLVFDELQRFVDGISNEY